jgi:toxin ParE1/3/4
MDIALYIAEDNPTRALSFVADLEATSERLGDAVGIGRARPELGDGVRALPHGNYLIFYRRAEDALRIERILHGARDITEADFGPIDA